MTLVPADRVQEFIAQAFQSVGMRERDAVSVSRLMTRADLLGADGHGIFRLPQYLRRIRAGGINLQPTIRVEQERGATALMNGDNGMGHLVVKQATELAIAKANIQGIGWVGCKMSNHAGPASLYAGMVADAGLVGVYFAVGSANHMAPWGGIELLLSTNPVAIAVPAKTGPAVVLDMATTVAAYGKVKIKAQKNELMPEGWMIDKQGQPLLDPKRSTEGLLLPIGGYKGYGLSLMIGLLAGTLNGAAMGRDVIDFNKDDTSVTNTGQAIAAIDISAFGDKDTFLDAVDQLVAELHESQTLPGVDRVRVPGEGSAASVEKRSKEGIPFSDELLSALEGVAKECGIAGLVQ
ncbi:Ldh family oxidoreductase [beta proteobacterium MWH-UniP1]